jgi:tripartite-type tricarboxylate transporter receptor subunit TctC
MGQGDPGREHQGGVSRLSRAFQGGSVVKLPHRRQFLHLAAGAAALPALSRLARAQAYPTRPVHIIVGFAPGGVVDIVGRLIGQSLSERLNQPFIIENRPGASSNIATEAVVRAPPDGYSLLLIGPQNAINTTLYDKLSFNFIRDIAPIAGLVRTPLVMVVHPTFPANTIADFIAYARANPGKINTASGGSGTPNHMSGELFKMMTGLDMTHVPYRGAAPALTDLLSGQVQVMFDAMPSSIGHIRAGRLRALAVTTAMRSEALPDVPTIGDFVPGYESSGWVGIGARKDTPADIIETLNKAIGAALDDPKGKARFVDLGSTILAGSPAEFGKLITDETEKWAKVIKFAGVKAD